MGKGSDSADQVKVPFQLKTIYSHPGRRGRRLKAGRHSTGHPGYNGITHMKLSWLVLFAPLFAGCAGAVFTTPVPSKVSVMRASDANGTSTWALVPSSYTLTKPAPWIIYDHGFGQSMTWILENPPQSSFIQSLAAAGYIVVASDYRSLSCWGDADCVEDIANLQTLWRAKLNLAPKPFVIGVSMGGIVTWNAVSHGALAPAAVVGIFPACNLANMYADPGFTPSIQEAYGFATSSEYPQATAGSDPALVPPSTFARFPIQIWASNSDTVVLTSQNEIPFAAAVNAAGGDVVLHPTRGDHGDPSNFDAPAVIAFFSAHRE